MSRALVGLFASVCSVGLANAQSAGPYSTYAPTGYQGFNLKEPVRPTKPKLLKQTPFSRYNDGGKADNFVLNHAGSVHDHYSFHSLRELDTRGIPQTGNNLFITTEWGNNAAGQVPDFDNHVLLPAGQGPYIGTGSQYTRSDQPFKSAGELFRRIDTGQFQIVFQNGTAQARLNQEVGGIATVPNPTPCVYGAGNCEEVKVSGNVPTGTYSQTTHNFNQKLLPNPSAPYSTTITGEGRVVVRNVSVDGVAIQPHNGVYSTSGTLNVTGDKSPRVDIEVYNLGFDPHALGSLYTLKWLNWRVGQDRVMAENRRRMGIYERQVAGYNQALNKYNKTKDLIWQIENGFRLNYGGNCNPSIQPCLYANNNFNNISKNADRDQSRFESSLEFLTAELSFDSTKYRNTRGGRPLQRTLDVNINIIDGSASYSRRSANFYGADINLLNFDAGGNAGVGISVNKSLKVNVSASGEAEIGGNLASIGHTWGSADSGSHSLKLNFGGAKVSGAFDYSIGSRPKWEVSGKVYVAELDYDYNRNFRYVNVDVEATAGLGAQAKVAPIMSGGITKQNYNIYGQLGPTYFDSSVNLDWNWQMLAQDVHTAATKIFNN